MSGVLDAVRSGGVIGIVRSADPASALTTVDRLVHGGLLTVEVSLVTPGAIDVIRAAVAEAPPGVFIGVGTAMTSDDVAAAASAGASFVVSPVGRESVVRASIDAGLDVFPGVATPSEAVMALEWGASMVKLFPGSLWTPEALKDVLIALPQLETVPTGGVSLEAIPDWIRAGAAALGLGGLLTKSADPVAQVQMVLATIAAVRS